MEAESSNTNLEVKEVGIKESEVQVQEPEVLLPEIIMHVYSEDQTITKDIVKLVKSEGITMPHVLHVLGVEGDKKPLAYILTEIVAQGAVPHIVVPEERRNSNDLNLIKDGIHTLYIDDLRKRDIKSMVCTCATDDKNTRRFMEDLGFICNAVVIGEFVIPEPAESKEN